MSRGRTNNSELHVYVDHGGRGRQARVRDAVVTPKVARVDPDERRSGQQPAEAGFRDKGEGEATCIFHRDRSGMWRGEDRGGKRWMANENGGVLYVYPDDGDDVAGGAIVSPTDPRSADRRRAGDRVLALRADPHGPDQIEGLRSWQAALNRFWAR